MIEKNPNAVALGSIKTKKKARASRLNGKLGGYYKHKKVRKLSTHLLDTSQR